MQDSPYVIKEAALLFEAGSYKRMDYTILVAADLTLRTSRVMSRDKLSKEEIIQRENKQMKQEEKIKMADFIIYNNGDGAIVKEILLLHKRFLLS